MSQLIGTEVHLRNLPHHPRVQLLVGELISHELVHFQRIGHLLIVIRDLALGNLLANLIGQNLLINLLKFFGRSIRLKPPLVVAALMAANGCATAGLKGGVGGQHAHGGPYSPNRRT